MQSSHPSTDQENMIRNTIRSGFRFVDQHAITITIGMVVGLIVIGSWLIYLISGLSKTPDWWVVNEQSKLSETQLIDRGVILENAITTQLTMVRDHDQTSWSTSIDTEQINAWLETRLRLTIETHMGEGAWPSEIGLIQIELVEDQMLIGMRILHAHGSNIVWANIGFWVDDSGDLWMDVSGTRLGRTGVPRWLMNLFVDQPIEESRYRVGPGSLDLRDGREVQMRGIRVNEGRLELAIQTLIHEPVERD